MKLVSIATLTAILAELSAADHVRGSEDRSLQGKECTFMIRDDLMTPSALEKGVGSDEPSYECEMDDGTTLPLIVDKAQHQLLTMMVEDGDVLPGEDSFEMATSGAMVSANGVQVQSGVEINFDKKSRRTGRRRLVTKEGNTYFLVVRVIDKNGLAHPHSTETMSDNMFGTINDPVNMKSQIYDCSAGKLNIIPGYPSGTSQSQKDAIDAVTINLGHPVGFMEANVDIDLKTAGSRYDVRNAVINKVNQLLGFNLPGPFDHVVFNLEKCYNDCGWAAYAYINSWNQVYQNNYYLQTGVLVHEYGHNLGMAHSGGLDGAAYTDHTCMMGNPLYSDDIGRMCYNPAKSYYIGWYDEGTDVFDSAVEDQWSGTLMGVGEWKDFTDGNHPYPVVVKLETGTATDYFVGFNRAAGANADNDEADDLVTIIETGNNGVGYSQSYLKGYIGSGESYTFQNWRGGGYDLIVSVGNIDITSNPGTAQVTISRDGTPFPTPPPTPIAGCAKDTVLVDITTDNYPQETSWEIKDSQGNVVASSPTYTTANTAQAQYSGCHSACGGEFIIKDTYGDGMCCNYGQGSYSVSVNGQSIVSEGGSFTAMEVTAIECGTNPTLAPTVSTDAPSASPSASPSEAPTVSTPAPTVSTPSPTVSTPAPTVSTPAPTVSTPAPTVSTPSPTVSTPAPTVSTPAPTVSTPSPTVSTPSPTVSTPSPTVSTPSPTVSTPSPTVSTPAPTVSTPAPTVSTPAPTVSTPAPTVSTPSPVEPTSPPVDPTSPPVEPTSPPVEPTSPPVEPTSPPVEPTSPPVEPTSPPVEPTSPPVEPTSPPVEPTSPPVEPTSPPVEPTFPPVEPTSPPVEPTSPPVEEPDEWDEIFYEGFESGSSEYFRNIGKKVKSNFSHDGTKSVLLRKKSKFLTKRRTISAYSTLKVDFYYMGVGMDEGDKFALQYKFNNSGKTWNDAGEWKKVAGGSFSDNNEWYFGTVTIPTNGKTSVVLRFAGRSNQNNDRIYIDDIFFGGKLLSES